MERYVLQDTIISHTRDTQELGSSYSQKLRKSDMIPANVIYRGISLPIFLKDKKQFTMMLNKSLSNVYKLYVEDKDLNIVVTIKGVQRHPISLNILHVDFIET